jgi:hypothetical protein
VLACTGNCGIIMMDYFFWKGHWDSCTATVFIYIALDPHLTNYMGLVL